MATASIYRDFGKAIATRRRELELTQETLASRVGLSRAAIANIENGRQNVLLHTVYELAGALGMQKISDLLPSVPKSPEHVMYVLDENVTDRERQLLNNLINAALETRQAKKSST
jgi:transcriptional regulator with XRE-family HTH domain